MFAESFENLEIVHGTALQDVSQESPHSHQSVRQSQSSKQGA